MPFYKFGPNDIFFNQIKTHPRCNFFFYEKKVYYNNKPERAAETFSELTPQLTPAGAIDLYELNNNRISASAPEAPLAPDFIYPFIIKDGSLTDFKTVSFTTVNDTSTTTFGAAAYGSIMTGSYPLSASIKKDYFRPNHVSRSAEIISQHIFPGTSLVDVEAVGTIDERREILRINQDFTPRMGSRISALKSTLDSYAGLSPHYAYTTVSSSADGWEKSKQAIGLVSIPSLFYGSSIKKGTVNLKFYITGTMVGELKDKDNNGELKQVGPEGSNGSGSVAGVVLYNEGFVLLTGSWNLTEEGTRFCPSHNENYTGSAGHPSWLCFAQTIATGSVTMPNSSFELNFSGTNYVPTMTMMAHAPRGKLSYSNNPTYVKFGERTKNIISHISASGFTEVGNQSLELPNAFSGSKIFYEERDMKVKNTVKSPYTDPTGSFKKQTFISKIGIYDEHRNLVGVAKVASPVKKTEDRDLTFKLKLDY